MLDGHGWVVLLRQYRPNSLAPSTTVRPMLATAVAIADERRIHE